MQEPKLFLRNPNYKTMQIEDDQLEISHKNEGLFRPMADNDFIPNLVSITPSPQPSPIMKRFAQSLIKKYKPTDSVNFEEEVYFDVDEELDRKTVVDFFKPQVKQKLSCTH